MWRRTKQASMTAVSLCTTISTGHSTSSLKVEYLPLFFHPLLVLLVFRGTFTETFNAWPFKLSAQSLYWTFKCHYHANQSDFSLFRPFAVGRLRESILIKWRSVSFVNMVWENSCSHEFPRGNMVWKVQPKIKWPLRQASGCRASSRLE